MGVNGVSEFRFRAPNNNLVNACGGKGLSLAGRPQSLVTECAIEPRTDFVQVTSKEWHEVNR